MTSMRNSFDRPVSTREPELRNNIGAAHKLPPPCTEDEVAFLTRPDTYSDGCQRVELQQTHMSWVFLTVKHAWKLKKPVRTEFLDFSTPELRRRNCAREVRLNRRLAPNVYLGVRALTMNRDGSLELSGHGKPVDWLVQMRRLPSDRMLDSLIATGELSEDDVQKLALLLTNFYRKATPVAMTASKYCNRLAADLDSAFQELTTAKYGVTSTLVRSAIEPQLKFIEANRDLFRARCQERRIIEGHGDLRPEHVCLEPRPVIIDCLEFNRGLRIVDTVSELMFLALECERLGRPEIGNLLLSVYGKETGDLPPDRLLGFYRAYHSAVRAKIAIWHLKDSMVDFSKWVGKAERYLRLAGDKGT
jgi:aminoglycoside phosphotransferase family enzyme